MNYDHFTFTTKRAHFYHSVSTVTSAPESMFALEGNSVMLPMWKRGNLDADDAVWVFNQTKDVVRYYPHHPKSQQLRVPAPYEDRVEFDTITFSLELKNLQEFDSGLYRGEINAGWRKTVVEYRLSIFSKLSWKKLSTHGKATIFTKCFCVKQLHGEQYVFQTLLTQLKMSLKHCA